MRTPNRRLKIYQHTPGGRRYLVSDCGRIVALEYRNSDGRLYRPKNVSISPNERGYLVFNCSETMVRHHRVIADLFIDNPECKPEVDHIDGDKQNNAVSNLRWVTSGQNKRAFRLKPKGQASKFRGVCFAKDKKKWRANIYPRGQRHFLGYFDNEEEAAKAFDAAAINHEYAKEALNFSVN